MPITPDMPASRLFDAIFSRWLTQFEHWKSIHLPPDELYRQVFDYSCHAVAEYGRRLTLELGVPFQTRIDAGIYALVALIDETVLYSSDWPALTFWQTCPLEYHLWQTHSAGDQFPFRVQTLLDERSPAERDLAALYLRCMTLGFGAKRNVFDPGAHQETCRMLWRVAFQQDVSADEIAQRLDANSLGSALQLPLRRRLPDNSRLHLIGVIILLALLLLSQRLWLSIENTIDTSTLPTFKTGLVCRGNKP
ncbi:T6SS protein Cts2U [Salmonella enterica subsp. enterica serovar Muenchen]|nr:T6SS protein Cts2U [Salmonella enterica subsp. enterica serovar Muenchen]ECZ7909649.1 T6SS protein Cts2U [Salmonella enterica subsp. enterica serovar Muenchen]